MKLTQEQINEMLKAERYNLKEMYLQDNYVYMVKQDGSDEIFKGFKGNLKQEEQAPYLICAEHTRQSWEEYEKLQQEQEPTEPSEPSLPDIIDQLFGGNG